MIKIAICDDSTSNANELTELLKVFAERIDVEISIDTYSSGKNMLFVWEDEIKYADILYLDISMPLVNGMEVADRIRNKGYKNEIIFFTRSETQMRKAFDVNAFHYIVKDDTSTEKMEEIFRRAVERAQHREKEYITFSSAGENRNVCIRDIKYFKVDGRIITVHYELDKVFDFYAVLGKLEEALCSKGFIRINRATIINVEHIETYGSQNIIMKDCETFQIGRYYRKQVKEELAYWFREVEM